MSPRIAICIAVVLALVGSSCSKESGSPKKNDSHDHAGHEHGADCDHDHDHDHDHKDAKKFDLGTAKAGQIVISATQIGLVTPGKGSVIEVKPSAALPAGSTVRAWVGEETGAGVKATGTFHADHGDHEVSVKVPMPLPAVAKWWVEIEVPGSGVSTASFSLKP